MDYIVKNLHFIFIHFPIALLIISLFFDLLSTFSKRQNLHYAALLTLVIGTLGAIGAVITGPENARDPGFAQHELFGKITMFFFIALTIFRLGLYWYRKKEIGNHPIYLIAALIGVLLVSYTGHLGGKMAHKDMKNMKPGDFGGKPPQSQQSPQPSKNANNN